MIFTTKFKELLWELILQLLINDLTVAYFEEKIFAILPQIYTKDFIDFFIRNYF